MSGQYALKITAEQAQEMPMVDLAFEVLKAANTPFYYRDLMAEIAKIKGLSDEEVMQVIAQLYTEINIDGRFACVGTNLWGLKRWYPVDKSDDAVASGKRPRIINDDDDELDEDLFPEEEDAYAEEEEYDSFDTVRDEDFEGDEVEEDSEFFEDEEMEEEELDEAEIEEDVDEEETETEDDDLDDDK
ncbi:DNA-directed RNA polymerase subunit delta [Paenibacillus ginsengihumi]|uniref:DNA-directed RNA polymerase subunit delta n=1 Tax=Paenibacillus ginsengihumi TaxID=431596 RepID=UPI00036B8276|nr:DNA-directed RNA polymerase subunit delta [Paenibacillus ginsengihumi]